MDSVGSSSGFPRSDVESVFASRETFGNPKPSKACPVQVCSLGFRV